MQEMKEEKESHPTVWSHKEEQNTHPKEDAADRHKIREALSICLDVFDINKRPENGVIRIYSSQVVNVHIAVELGEMQCRDLRVSSPLASTVK